MAPRPFDLDAHAARIVEALDRLGGATFADIQIELNATTPTWTKRALATLIEQGRVVTTVEERATMVRLSHGTRWTERRYRATVYRLVSNRPARRPRGRT